MSNAAERAQQLALISRLKATYPEVPEWPMPDQMAHSHFLAYMKNPHDVGGELDVPAAYEDKEEEQWELMTYVLCEVLGMRGIWVSEERRRIDRERELAAPKITLDNIFKHLEKQGRRELALVVKGDVQGSVEALKGMLAKLPTEEVVVSVKSASAGGINESDVSLAEATKAIIVGFNVTSSGKARQLAEAKGIEIRLYEVIYDLIDDVTKAARGLLAPELKLEVLGHAEVRQVFKISKVGAIAGCYVTDGVVERNAQIRVTRDGIVVEKDRRLEQLKRFKDDAKEVRAGNECGMKIVGYDDIKVGDVLECYKTVTVQRT